MIRIMLEHNSQHQDSRPAKRVTALRKLSRIYFALLFAWFFLFLLFGDGNGYLGLANSLAVYFFVPLPFAILVAVRAKNRRLQVASLLAIVIFAWLWGPLFWPNAPIDSDGARLRVMTLNVLGQGEDPSDVLASIRAENADVVMLQEVTHEFANAALSQLGNEYPYSVLNAGPKASGMAVLSRFPIQLMDVVLGGRWRGDPQLLSMDWEGRQITLVNFHTVSTGTVVPRWVDYTYRLREDSVARLADFADDSDSMPLIMAGDGNLTRLNDTYQLLDAQLDDAWWAAGWGLGHTFPGNIEPNDWFTRVSFFIIPHWLVRIDYIFYSVQFQAERTWLAEFNGGSDHRGVVTDLVLVGD